jgi:hypothetical protein
VKRKSALCSTGHDTGASYVRGLSESLRLSKIRKLHKIAGRRSEKRSPKFMRPLNG